ncbi:MAG: glycosyltransferase family 39 protein [Chloroflexota bacterium]|nr:MAG: glycosyltransferase family 39 protein [Chloroflexota bacterium]
MTSQTVPGDISALSANLRVNFVIGWAAGMFSLILLLSIPRDVDNVGLFGYSLSRLGLIGVLGFGVLLASVIAFRSVRDTNWLDSFARRLIRFSAKDEQTDIVLWGTGIGLVSSIVFFLAAFDTKSPYLIRISPLVLWFAITCLQIVILSLRFDRLVVPDYSEFFKTSLRSHAALILIILLLALGVRLYVLFAYEVPLEQTRRQEIATLVAKRHNLTFCNTYFPFCGAGNNTTASVEPLPILAFAAMIIVFKTHAEYLGVLIQMILGLASIGVLYLIIRMLLKDHRPAFLGAFLWGVYVPLILETEASLKGEAFFIVFLLLGMFFIVLGMGKKNILIWLVAGFCLGLAALSRSVLIYFIPVLSIALLITPIMTVKRRLMNIGLTILAFVVVLTPWTIRNFNAFNAFIPGVTLSGYNLYRHNHILEDDDYLRYVYNREMKAAQRQLLEDNADILRGDENEYEMDQLYRQEAMEIILANPFRYLLLSLYRFIPLWTNYGVRYGYISDLTWNISGLVNLIFLGLAIFSLVRRRGMRPPEIIPIVMLLFFYTVSYMLVNARMRFIIPLIPFVLVFTSDQIIYLASKFRSTGDIE